MPVLELYTNKTIPNKKELAIKATSLMSQLLGKPESLMIIKIVDDVCLTFAGTFDPAYTANVYSIGKISPEMNTNTSAGLNKFFEEEMGLPGDRGYIGFHDMKGSNMGYKGATF